jgi:formylglycine-generating enzyme required for sulfatase activity
MDFCRWLAKRTGLNVNLPTEAQWEWACRAGAATPLHFGNVDSDFSSWGNVGDAAFARGPTGSGFPATGGLEHLLPDGAALADTRFNDRAVVTCEVGSYCPNDWGLYDMHGNAAEWTRSDYAPPLGMREPRDSDKSRPKVVRGGSFFDPPRRCRSSFRLAYPVWQRLFNVGFRIVVEEPPGHAFNSVPQ